MYSQTIKSTQAMLLFGEQFGRALKGGEVVELSGDVGTGKTTFTKGLARGLEIGDVVQSPTFTISRVYNARDGLTLYHYDFYRLKEAGIMRAELAESLSEPMTVVALEWDETVRDLLPIERTIRFMLTYGSDETSRLVTVTVPTGYECLLEPLQGTHS